MWSSDLLLGGICMYDLSVISLARYAGDDIHDCL
jgi:hypothetical protein